MREHLYRALASKNGIVLTTDDPPRLIQKLNAERRKANDASLKQIIIATSRTNPSGEVWLIKKEPQGAQEDGQTAGDGDG